MPDSVRNRHPKCVGTRADQSDDLRTKKRWLGFLQELPIKTAQCWQLLRKIVLTMGKWRNAGKTLAP